MRKDTGLLSEMAIFVAGVVAAGLLTARRKDTAAASAGPSGATQLQDAVAALEARVARQEARFAQIEAQLDEHAAKLAEAPSTGQVVGAMEQLLAKTMSSLDQRLTTQAHSIEVLKTTVAQTDSLLERVLESLDSLQSYTEPLEGGADTLLKRVG